MSLNLTKDQRNTIHAIIGSLTRISLDKEAVKDDVAALAVSLGVKPAAVNSLIATVIAEQNKGGVIEEKQQLLDLAAQVIDGTE